MDPYLKSVLDAIAEDERDGPGPMLITVDELRAAGALDVPPSWRKSLVVERDLFSEFLEKEKASQSENLNSESQGIAKGESDYLDEETQEDGIGDEETQEDDSQEDQALASEDLGPF